MFTGTSDRTECEAFLYQVRKKGFMEGRHNDNVWMAGYAASCFKGDALLWHMGLDPEIQHDWNRLQRALAAQYLSRTESRVRYLARSVWGIIY